MEFIKAELKRLKNDGLYRQLRALETPQNKIVRIAGKEYLAFCSNNYLGLADDLRLKEAAARAIEKYGCGTGASRLVSGNMKIHQELEKKIAEFKKTDAAILFPTGYMANIGTISALVGPGDAVIIDKLNHASIIDGCRMSRAKILVYKHSDINSLETVLENAKSYAKRLIITDTIFSMDGDIAPLPEIVALAKKYNSMLMIDDAHATGLLGKNGRGALEHFDLENHIEIVMGTLSKAIGSIGGFVAGSKNLIDYLRNKARSFIYTTAPPPAACAASIRAIEIIESEPDRRQRLWENVRYAKDMLKKTGYDTMNSATQIIPVLIGVANTTVEKSNFLFHNGILIPAIRPPTVPKEQSRLRITLMSQHTKSDIDRLLSLL